MGVYGVYIHEWVLWYYINLRYSKKFFSSPSFGDNNSNQCLHICKTERWCNMEQVCLGKKPKYYFFSQLTGRPATPPVIYIYICWFVIRDLQNEKRDHPYLPHSIPSEVEGVRMLNFVKIFINYRFNSRYPRMFSPDFAPNFLNVSRSSL